MLDEQIERYGARLYALCLRLCRNRFDADDLYQDTWYKAMRAYRKYDPARPFDTWLTTICVNTYRDQYRRRKLAEVLGFGRDEQPDFWENVAAPPDDPYPEVREAVDALPESLRLVVMLYYFEDCDIAQTAQLLGVPEGTVKSRLARARAKLKGVLDDDGG